MAPLACTRGSQFAALVEDTGMRPQQSVKFAMDLVRCRSSERDGAPHPLTRD